MAQDAPVGGAVPGEVVVCVLAYEAEDTIEEVLDSVALDLVAPDGSTVPLRVVVADDASTDATVERTEAWIAGRADHRVELRCHETNLGYGGNQRACLQWAVDEGAAVVALLHGDAQYPGARVPDLVAPILTGTADAVIGSRMVDPGAARRGGMPAVRRIGNRSLTAVQNLLTGARLSEWHSGMRAYSTDALRALDLGTLPATFDIDTALTLDLLDHGARFSEVAIPTRYADEVSRIPLTRTGFQILGRTLRHRWRR